VNGEIEAPILIIDRINSDLERVLKPQDVVLNVHPLWQHTYKGFPSLRSKWFLNIKSG
jgi:ribonuclease G